MARALVLGGTGTIGRAVARRLLPAGWQVDLAGRTGAHLPADLAARGASFLRAFRSDQRDIVRAVGPGADLLVDCTCYTAADARMLLPLLASVGSAVMISSKAVYVDSVGNHANSPVAPRFGGPVDERQPTMAPSDVPYDTPEGYGANKVAAELVLLESGHPVTVLRPGLVHGPGARRPREWVFVKRALDKRPYLLLAHRGAGVAQTTAAANIASLVALAAEKPGRRVLNAADPDAPSALEISRVVANRLGHDWEEVLLGDDDESGLGGHPWDVPSPVVLDMTAALQLGYQPAGSYSETVAQELDWLVDAARGGDPDGVLPAPQGPFFHQMFDYEAEDSFVAARSGPGLR